MVMADETTILNENDYYDYTRVLSYHAPWIFIIGARGLGKTYGGKKLMIDDWVKRRWQFIYLRRTAEEQKNKGTFFNDIADSYPELDFRVNGNQAECHWADDRDAITDKNGKKKSVWHIVGYFIALSQAGQVKSVAYPRVRTILFDEIFPDNMRYLGGEVTALEEFYNTVDRWHDRVRLIMCSNAVSLANPYFAAFNINVTPQIENKTQYQRYCDSFIVVELADYGGFSAKIAKSRFGQFLSKFDADYAAYSIDNTFRDNSNALISNLSGAGYVLSIKTREYGSFAVYQILDDSKITTVWQIARRQPKKQKWYTLNYRLVDEKCILLKRSDDIIKRLIEAYRVGRVRFETPQTKSEFSMLLGTLLNSSKTR